MPIPVHAIQSTKPSDKWIRFHVWIPLRNINGIWVENIAVALAQAIAEKTGGCEDMPQVLWAIKTETDYVWEPFRKLTAIIDEKKWKEEIGVSILDSLAIYESMLGGKHIYFLIEAMEALVGEALPE